MKTIIKTLTILLIIGATFNACKKYEDGPMISLRTKKARISGDWKIQNATFNNVDITPLMPPNYTFDIEKDGKYKLTTDTIETGTWKFGEDKDDVYFDQDGPGAVETAYHILKLKNKDLWLKNTASNGDVTVLKLVPAK
jgi:hypothetical protein